MILLCNRSNALRLFHYSPTIGMAVASHCDGRHTNGETFAGEAIFCCQRQEPISVGLKLRQRTAERATSDGRDSSASGFAGSSSRLSATGRGSAIRRKCKFGALSEAGVGRLFRNAVARTDADRSWMRGCHPHLPGGGCRPDKNSLCLVSLVEQSIVENRHLSG